MSIAVTYRLPPYVTTVANPHYDLFRGYATLKLQDLGNYPIGKYRVEGVSTTFNGVFQAVSSTNDSITLSYQSNPGRYPAKNVNTDFPFDVNNYEFAYKPYERGNDVWRGIANESQYDEYIFDFDTRPGQDTSNQTTIEIVEPIIYTKQIDDRVYGYAVVRLDQLPGFTDVPTTDPSGLDLAQVSDRDKIVGRYLIVASDIIGDGGDFQWEIYPSMPFGISIDISFSQLPDENPPDTILVENGHPVLSGRQVIIRYDSLYTAQTGPGYGRVFPYRVNKSSRTKPAIITLPDNVEYSPYRFYTDNTEILFDLYGDYLPPVSPAFLPQNKVPGNLIKIGK